MGFLLTKNTKKYLSLLIFITAVVFYVSISRYDIDLSKDLIILIIFTIIAESLVIFTPNHGGVTLSFGVILPVAVLFGPSSAILCGALGNLLSVYKMDGKFKHLFNIEFYKTAVNTANYMISSAACSYFYIMVNGSVGVQNIYTSMLYMMASALVYVVVNIAITNLFLSFMVNNNVKEIWLENFSGLIPNVLGVSAVSIIITLSYLNFGVESIIVLFFPYLLIRYSFQLVFDMKQAYLNTIKALSSALEEKDPYTKGHSERVEKYSAILAKELNTKIDFQQLQYAAIFHDIGKIGINDSILNKPGKLSDEEYEQIKQHPSKGMNILGNVGFLKKATKIIGAHHEYCDGTGYPQGLKQEEIPLESKIITVVDIFDAVTTDRPYRKAMTDEEAIEILRRESGTKLDPAIVDKFIKLHNEGRLI
ncbi:HD-GYP domain-containing protein [Alkalibacter mobilis]|uniref:HD-GYP domain-containing protein n=1 Tax=Alkalibacter mobilis TaxID=2787712 RepID=UPI00189EB613|nr:HD-GYP domain-containing protein [Alkalibacter mobilis]MBF7096591.1 HD-GYP domain-containing protein [Alkalibacter mobilis]